MKQSVSVTFSLTSDLVVRTLCYGSWCRKCALSTLFAHNYFFMNVEGEEDRSEDAYATTLGMYGMNTSLGLAISMLGQSAKLDSVISALVQFIDFFGTPGIANSHTWRSCHPSICFDGTEEPASNHARRGTSLLQSISWSSTHSWKTREY